MNDRLKFRVWDTEKKYFLLPYPTLDNRILPLGEDHIPSFLICGNGDIAFNCGSGFSYCGGYDKKRYIIQQYIGLKDKNNKEIYEGDILFNKEWNYPNCVVEFGLRNCFRSEDSGGNWHYNISNGFLLRFINHKLNILRNFEFDEDEVDKEKMILLKTKVIGNIFENPNLIKQ